MSRKLFNALAVVLTMLAATIASSACAWYLYQPKAPKCLSK